MTSGQGGEGQRKSLDSGTLLIGEIGPSGLRGGLVKIVQLTAPAGILQVAGPQHSGALFIRGRVIRAATSPEHRLTDMAALAHILSVTAGKYRFSTELPPVTIPESLNIDLSALLSWHSGAISQQPSLLDALRAITNAAAIGPGFDSGLASAQMLGRPGAPTFTQGNQPGVRPAATNSAMSQPAPPDLQGADPFGLQAALANYEEKRREELEKLNVVPGAWLDTVYDPDARTMLHLSAIQKIPIPLVEAPDRSHDAVVEDERAAVRKKVVKTAGISLSVVVGLVLMAVAISTTSKYLQANNAESQYHAGMQSLHDGYNDLAKTHFDEVLQLSPGNADALLGRALASSRMGDYAAALRDYDQVISAQPKNIEALYGRAATFLGLKEYLQAMDSAQAALAIDATHMASLHVQARAQLGLNDYEKAIATASGIISREPPAVLGPIFATRGEAYYKAGRLAEAKKDFSEAIKINENDKSSYAIRARVEFQTGDYKAAIEDANEAVFGDATNADLFLLRGQAYEKLGEVEKAAADFDKAVGLRPGTDTYLARSRTDIAAKKYTQAKADLEQVVKDPKAPRESKSQLAMVEEKIKSMPAVQLNLDRLVGKEAPVQKLTYQQMVQAGFALLESGKESDHVQAMHMLETAARANPKDVQTRRYLARAYDVNGRMEDAIKQFRQVQAVQPLDAQDKFHYGHSYFLLKQPKQGAELARSALEQDPDYHPARVLLIQCLLPLNEKAQAIGECEIGLSRAKSPEDRAKFQQLMKTSETWQNHTTE